MYVSSVPQEHTHTPAFTRHANQRSHTIALRKPPLTQHPLYANRRLPTSTHAGPHRMLHQPLPATPPLLCGTTKQCLHSAACMQSSAYAAQGLHEAFLRTPPFTHQSFCTKQRLHRNICTKLPPRQPLPRYNTRPLILCFPCSS